MTARRSLTDGLKATPPVPPEAARQFMDAVLGSTATPLAPKPLSMNTRSPLTVRIRTEYAEALKRASLERQLNKIEPYHLQDIIEQALQPWLRANGYIS